MSIKVFCRECNKTYCVKDELAGKRGKCPQKHVLLIPEVALSSSHPTPQPKASPTREVCPSCDTVLKPKSVICVNCGFDIRTGKIIAPAIDSKTGRQSSRQVAPSSDRKKLLFLGGGIAAVVIAVATNYLLFFRNGPPGTSVLQAAVVPSVPTQPGSVNNPKNAEPPKGAGIPATQPPPKSPPFDQIVNGPITPKAGGPLSFQVNSLKTKDSYEQFFGGRQTTTQPKAGFTFLLVNVTVQNTSARQEMFSSPSFRILDQAGKPVDATFLGFDNTICTSGSMAMNDWSKVSVGGESVVRFKGMLDSNESKNSRLDWELASGKGFTTTFMFVIPEQTKGPRFERAGDETKQKAADVPKEEKKAFITQELFDKILAGKMTEAQITEILGAGRASGRTTIPEGMTEKVWEDSKHNSIMIQFKEGKAQGGKSTIYDNK